MNIVSLDVHSEASQVAVVSGDTAEILMEMRIETDPQKLREFVAGVQGPTRVILEEGPLSGMLVDALSDVADEVISCDPSRNASTAPMPEACSRTQGQ